MVWLKKIWKLIKSPYLYVQQERAYRKRLKKMREKDPFIYK